MKFLRYSADYRTLFAVALYFAVAICSWVYWNEVHWTVNVLMVVVNCVMSFLCAVIVHNTVHVPIFYSTKANKLFQIVLSFTYGHPVTAFVPGHNFSHHKYTQTLKDSQRTSKMRFKINFFNQLLYAFVMANDVLSAELRFAKKMYKEKPKWFWQYAIELGLVLGIKAILLIVDWQKFIFLVLIPHQYAVWGVLGTNYFQHDGCDETHPYNHSRSFSGKWLNAIMFNNGYHGAHHMKPGLHWSKLPQFHEENIRPYLHPNLDLVSLPAYLWKATIWPGKRLDYLGNPVVLAPKQADEDWIEEIKVAKYEEDLAAA